MITDEMRNTKRDPAAGGRPAAGGSLDARRSRHRRRRVIEALGDELGELLHPHGYRGDSRARRRASAPTALAAAVARESSLGRHVDGRHIPTSASRRHASSRTPFGRRPIRTRMGVIETPRGAPRRFSLLLVSVETRSGARSPSSSSGRQARSTPKPTLISICARFSIRHGNARGETTPCRWPEVGYRSATILPSPTSSSMSRTTARAAVFTWRQKQAAAATVGTR